jgi:hypothetical protein
MSKPGPTKQETRRKRRRLERQERIERLQQHHDKIELYRALGATHEQLGNHKEARHCRARIRTIEQQMRYIGEEYEQ